MPRGADLPLTARPGLRPGAGEGRIPCSIFCRGPGPSRSHTSPGAPGRPGVSMIERGDPEGREVPRVPGCAGPAGVSLRPASPPGGRAPCRGAGGARHGCGRPFLPHRRGRSRTGCGERTPGDPGGVCGGAACAGGRSARPRVVARAAAGCRTERPDLAPGPARSGGRRLPAGAFPSPSDTRPPPGRTRPRPRRLIRRHGRGGRAAAAAARPSRKAPGRGPATRPRARKPARGSRRRPAPSRRHRPEACRGRSCVRADAVVRSARPPPRRRRKGAACAGRTVLPALRGQAVTPGLPAGRPVLSERVPPRGRCDQDCVTRTAGPTDLRLAHAAAAAAPSPRFGPVQAGFGAITISICRPSMRGCCSTRA